MNHLEGLKGLRNKYFGMRHGQSRANVLHLVCGDPSVGVAQYGLTPTGRVEVRQNVLSCSDLDSSILIYSSDFLRAIETASIAQSLTCAKSVLFVPELRERYFGIFEGTSSTAYDFVHNSETPELYSRTCVESRESILDRTTGLIKKLEQEHNGRKILLVSHGDPLFILEGGFGKKTSELYEILGPIMRNAEIREFKLVD